MKTTNKKKAKLPLGYVKLASSESATTVHDEKLCAYIRGLFANYEFLKRSEIIKRARLNKNQ